MSCSSSFVVDVAFASTVAFELARSALFGMLVAEIVVVVFVAAIAVEAEVVVMLYSVTDFLDNLATGVGGMLLLVGCRRFVGSGGQWDADTRGKFTVL